jgi:hypothetical protein
MTEVAASVRRSATVNRTDAKNLNTGECCLEFMRSPIREATGYRVKAMAGTLVPAIALEAIFLGRILSKQPARNKTESQIRLFQEYIIPVLLNFPAE